MIQAIKRLFCRHERHGYDMYIEEVQGRPLEEVIIVCKKCGKSKLITHHVNRTPFNWEDTKK